MNALTESRSIAYSADMAGRSGRIACHVVRADATDDGRATYSIVVRNDTASDAQASAFAAEPLDIRARTLVQSIVGPYSDFSTTVEIDLERYGGIPAFHVELSGDDIAFALIVPGVSTEPLEPRTDSPHAAIVAHPAANGAALATVPPQTSLPRVQMPRMESRSDAYGSRSPRRPNERPDLQLVADANRSPAALPMFFAFGAIVLAVGFGILRPQVSELVVPAQVSSSGNIPIAYRATGLGAASYRVVGPDAEAVASGPLATGSGTFTVALPKDRANRAYLVRVAIAGPFGSGLAEDYLKIAGVPVEPPRAAVATPRVIPPPEIRSLALDRAMLAGGDTLNVYYDVAAASGSVSLFDPGSQITYGKSDLSASGHTAFVVPAMQTERSLSVIVTAKRGSTTTQSRVAVTASPRSSPTPQADATGTGATADSAAFAVPVLSAPATVGSAQPFRVAIRDAVPGLVLVLRDADGAELARREIDTADSQSSANFTAPSVRAPTSLRLEVTYPQGAGSETIVKSIAVTAR